MTDTPNLGFTYLEEGQANAEVAVNDALNRMDMILQAAVIDRDLTAPPGSESNGDVYLVAASATGDWAGKDGQLAGYYDGYIYATVNEGFILRVLDENIWIGWTGSAWETIDTTP